MPSGRDDSFTIRGVELQGAVRWLGDAAKHGQPQPTDLQSQFIQASQKAEADEIAKLQQLYRTALARQLAAQAELTRQQQGHLIELSILLGVESLRRTPSPEGIESLHRSLALLPPAIARFQSNDRVLHLAFSPDGSVLAAASGNNVQLWSMPAGQPFADVAQPNQVNAVAFDPSGRFLAAACGGYVSNQGPSAVQVLDLQTGRAIWSLPHPDSATTIAWHPNGIHLTSGCADGLLRVWDLRSGQELYSTKATSKIDDVAYSPKGDLLACAGMFDNAVLIYPAAFNQPPRRLLHEGADRVGALAFSPDGTLLAAVDGFNVAQSSIIPIRIWDMKSDNLVRVLYLRDITYGVFSVTFALNGRQILAAGGDQTARVLSINGEGEVARLPHKGIVNKVAFCDSRGLMASAGEDRQITVWPAWDGREAGTTEVFDCCDPRNAFAFSLNPEQNVAALAIWDVRTIDLASGKTLACRDFGGLALGASFSPDGLLIAICGKTDHLEIVETQGLRPVLSISIPSTFRGPCSTHRGGYSPRLDGTDACGSSTYRAERSRQSSPLARLYPRWLSAGTDATLQPVPRGTCSSCGTQ